MHIFSLSPTERLATEGITWALLSMQERMSIAPYSRHYRFYVETLQERELDEAVAATLRQLQVFTMYLDDTQPVPTSIAQEATRLRNAGTQAPFGCYKLNQYNLDYPLFEGVVSGLLIGMRQEFLQAVATLFDPATLEKRLQQRFGFPACPAFVEFWSGMLATAVVPATTPATRHLFPLVAHLERHWLPFLAKPVDLKAYTAYVQDIVGQIARSRKLQLQPNSPLLQRLLTI